MTETSKATTKATTPTSFTATPPTSPTSYGLPTGRAPAVDHFAGAGTRFPFHIQHIGNRREFPKWCGIQDVGNRVDDAQEGQPAGEEGVDGLLVGRVEDGRRGATGA